jgi:hypothetical protein
VPRRRFRLNMRTGTLAAAAFAIGVALLILWLGHRQDLVIDRLVEEGVLAEGRFLSREYGSCSNDSCDSDRIHVAYAAGGVTYRTSMVVSRQGREPVFEAEVIRVPRLGPERPLQVVYLASAPATARLREDLSKSAVAVYGTAGMFLLVGLVFGAAGLFLLRPRAARADAGPVRTGPALSQRAQLIGFAVVFVGIWAAGLYLIFFL